MRQCNWQRVFTQPRPNSDIAERNCCTAVGQLWGRGMIRAPPFGTADRPAFLSKINARESDRGLIYICRGPHAGKKKEHRRVPCLNSRCALPSLSLRPRYRPRPTPPREVAMSAAVAVVATVATVAAVAAVA